MKNKSFLRILAILCIMAMLLSSGATFALAAEEAVLNEAFENVAEIVVTGDEPAADDTVTDDEPAADDTVTGDEPAADDTIADDEPAAEIGRASCRERVSFLV